MIIRQATINDVDDIAKIHVDTWNTTYSDFIPNEYLKARTYTGQAKKWIDRIFNNATTSEFLYVAQNKEGKVIGFASGAINSPKDKYDSTLYTIYILEKYQRQRIGYNLLKAVAQQLKNQGASNMVLWAFSENKSRKFYESLGGSVVDKKNVTLGDKNLEEIAYIFEIEELMDML